MMSDLRLSPLWSKTNLQFAALLLLAVAIVTGILLFQHSAGQPQVLRVGFNQFVPYVLINSRGEPDGLAAEMVKRSAVLAGVPIRWVLVKGEIDDALRKKQIDVYPLLTITAQRKSEFYVSQPWWENEIALISTEQKPLLATSNTSGKRIAIRGLPVVKLLAETLFPRATFVLVPRMEDMVGVLCKGDVDGLFLDLRLLESQLLKGVAQCPGQALHVTSLPNGRLSLATIANPAVSHLADRLYEGIAQLSANGALSEIAARWQLYNTFQNRHLRDTLDSQHRASLMRYGLAGMMVILLLIVYQTLRMRRSHSVAEQARRMAEESQQRFNAFMRHMPAVAFIKKENGQMDYVNDAFCTLFRMSRESVFGKLDHELWPAELADSFRANDLRVLSSGKDEELLEVAVDELGALRSFLSYKFRFTNSAGEQLLGGVAIDITERLRVEQALKLSQFSIDCSQDTILWIDRHGQIFNANRAACRSLAYERNELIGLHIAEIDLSVNRDTFANSRHQLKTAGSLTLETLHRRKDGVTYPVEIWQNFLDFEGQEYSCCMSRDITERKEAEVELSRQALHDALTGLPNRRYLERCLASAIDKARPQQSNIGVVYLDLDGFKLVNDTLGHSVGDQLLKKVAARLRESLRDSDMLFRMGGDEFALVLSDVPDRASIALIAHKLLANLHESFTVERSDLTVTASIGVSLFPDDGIDESELLRNADAAMYESKRQGKNRVQFFTRQMGEDTRERLELENHLRRALARKELSLHYQPEFCTRTGIILRHEALLRWKHPTLGDIPPGKFISIAEETALIVPIGTWVLEEACRRAAEWQHEAKDVGVGVNVSLVQFARPDFVSTVIGVLERTGLPAHLLDLELTESVLMKNVADTADKIKQLRTLGLSISIDDFGTGYSSLSYLQQLPINTLKIDRSFIRDLASDPNSASLTGALISMAHSLHMNVVVEGIETFSQMEALQLLGCDIGQGYFLGRPTAVPLLLLQSVAA